MYANPDGLVANGKQSEFKDKIGETRLDIVEADETY